ncbi:MAG: signal peptide peptidase SppA [Pseudomonadota bacterium]
MSYEELTPDTIIERRKLRRSRSTWRVLSVIFGVFLIIALLAFLTPLGDRLAARGDHIARVEVNGFIDFDRRLHDLIDDFAEEDDVKAVLLRINSPGGLAVGGEALFTALSELRETKPIVAVIDGVGTSAAYLTASAAEHIVARNGSIVGSIGVLAQIPDASELLGNVGVNVREVRSGALKAQPSLFNPPEDAAIDAVEAMIADNFNWFVDQIADRRSLDAAVIRGFEGRVFTGSRGVQIGLVDTIGGEDEAISYLSETHGIDEDTKILTRRPRGDSPLGGATASTLVKLGLDEGQIDLQFTGPAIRDSLRDAMLLDGILSVWHP